MDKLKFASRHVARELEGVRARSKNAYRLFVAWFKPRKPRRPPPPRNRRAPAIRRPGPASLIDLRNRASRLSRPTVVSQLCFGSGNRPRTASAPASAALDRIATAQPKRIRQRPRKIDLDNETIATPELQVPHPRMLQRRFVLTPLAELAPELKHPAWEAPAAVLLERLTDPSQVRHL